jgi:arylsulfatase A-like enzyme
MPLSPASMFRPFALLAAIVVLVSPSVAADPARPNVIMIYADDLGYGDLSCYGASRIQTPNVDRLAQNGLRFTNGRSTAASCTPSRYSILTGEYAWRKKGTSILPGDAPLIIPQDRTTLGKVFQKAGYRTAVIGKWHLGLGPEGGADWNAEVKPGPNEVGFDYSFILPATGDRVPTVYVKDHRVVALDPADPIQVDYEKKIGNEPTVPENPELLKLKSLRGHDNTITNGIGRIGWMSGGLDARWTDEALAPDFTDEVNDFIEANRQRPFFIFHALHDIHVPRVPSVRFKGKSPMGARGDAILQMDYYVGKIMDKLDAEGLTTNTIVLLSSDNGPVLNDGYDDKSEELVGDHKPAGPWRGGKYSVYEGGTRVPFILHWPAQVKAGVSDALVSQVDFVRSFAALTGQELNSNDAPDSKNIIDAITGKSAQGRESVVVAGRNRALLKGDWKYIEPGDAKQPRPKMGDLPAPQLYHLENDPAETNNLAADRPEILESMASELRTIITTGGEAQ